MSLYLKIENPGVAPVEAFTLLGASTTRYAETSGTIGTFGTGSKHAIPALLRRGINPIIYCGTVSLSYYTKDVEIDDGIGVSHVYPRVHYRIKGKFENGQQVNRDEQTSFTTEFGQKDWTTTMGIREFVANALDRSLRESLRNAGIDADNADRVGLRYIKNVVMEIVQKNEVRAKSGYTRIFIPLHEDVATFFANKGKHFLHFSEPNNLKKKVLPKADRSPAGSKQATIYRHGVLVRTIRNDSRASVFDYNLGDELELDDSRVASDWDCQYYSGMALGKADSETLAIALKTITDGEDVWESDFHGLTSGYDDESRRKNFQKAWESVAGGDGVVVSDNNFNAIILRARGKNVKRVKSSYWRKALEDAGVSGEWSELNDDEKQGREKLEGTEEVTQAALAAWSILSDLDMTNGKDYPSFGVYHERLLTTPTKLSFYDETDQKCYIHTSMSACTDEDLLVRVCLEALTTYVTGYERHTDGYCAFAFNLALKAAKTITA